MGDKDDRLALLGERVHDFEQLFHFLRSQHSGWFIKNKDVGLAVQQLDNFYPLLDADRQVRTKAIGSTSRLYWAEIS